MDSQMGNDVQHTRKVRDICIVIDCKTCEKQICDSFSNLAQCGSHTNERTNRLRNVMIMLCEPFNDRQYFAHNFIIALIKMSYMLIRIVSCDFDHLIALKCLARYDDRIARQVQRDARSFSNNRFVMSLVFQADYIRLDVMMMTMMSTAQSFTSAIIINGYVAHKPRHQTRSSHTIYKKNH